MQAENTGNASLMQQVAIDVMKKAMDTQSKEVLSVLQSTAMPRSVQTPNASIPNVAALTGLGQKIDIKG